MKSLKILSLAVVLVFMAFSANAQSCCSGKKAEKGACCSKAETQSGSASVEDAATTTVLVANVAETQIETFKVFGNCGMCKTRIEGALKEVKGIQSAEWDVDTKMLKVSYDGEAITLDDIEKKVAAVGHDTERFRAEDSVYSKLHGCCQYDRA